MTAAPPRPDEREQAIRADVQAALREALEGGDGDGFTPGPRTVERARRTIAERIARAQREAVALGEPPLTDSEGFARRLLDDLVGMGPLQPLLDTPDVEEIIVNGPRRVMTIADGRKRLTEVRFADDGELLRLVRRAIGPLGGRLDETSPMVDARLADGSRLNAVIPPLATSTHVTIRRFLARARTLDDLVALETLSPDAAAFLAAAVRARLNLLISGGTGSGKTTCLAALGTAVGGIEERVVTIEETAELRLDEVLPDCVALVSRAANAEGAGEVPIRALVRNALRMRPTRIVVGEVRGGEALDMLAAQNSGHEGSMCSLHANGPREALGKLATYALMAGEAVPPRAVAEMIAVAVQLVVHLRLDPATHRRVVSSIVEVTGIEGETVLSTELFTTRDGALAWAGMRPRAEARLREAGWTLPAAGGAR